MRLRYGIGNRQPEKHQTTSREFSPAFAWWTFDAKTEWHARCRPAPTFAPAPDSVAALAQRVRDAVAHVLAIEAGEVPPSRASADEVGSLKTEVAVETVATTENAMLAQAIAQVEQAQATVLQGSLKAEQGDETQADEAVQSVVETENAVAHAAALGSLKTANADATQAETAAPAIAPAAETAPAAPQFNLAEIVAASGLQFVETDAAALKAAAERVQPTMEPRLRRSDVPRVEAVVASAEMVQVETIK